MNVSFHLILLPFVVCTLYSLHPWSFMWHTWYIPFSFHALQKLLTHVRYLLLSKIFSLDYTFPDVILLLNSRSPSIISLFIDFIHYHQRWFAHLNNNMKSIHHWTFILNFWVHKLHTCWTFQLFYKYGKLHEWIGESIYLLNIDWYLYKIIDIIHLCCCVLKYEFVKSHVM